MPTRRFWFTAAAVTFMVATRPTALPELEIGRDLFAVLELPDLGGCAQPPLVPIALEPGCEGVTGFIDQRAEMVRFCGRQRKLYPEYPVEARCVPFQR
jgi:hypothetical protein